MFDGLDDVCDLDCSETNESWLNKTLFWLSQFSCACKVECPFNAGEESRENFRIEIGPAYGF